MADPVPQQNLASAEPNITDLLNLYKKAVKLELNCHHLGTIQSFDPDAQTATVTINYKKSTFELNEEGGGFRSVLIDYPLIVDVPVIILGGGPVSLTFPIVQGDQCILLFNDRDIDNWFQGSNSSGNATLRLHSFSDAIALVGLHSQANPLSGYDIARGVLKDFAGGAMVGVGGAKVKVANNTVTLNDALQELLTELNDLVTQLTLLTVTCATPGNPSSVPINSVAITNIGTRISNTSTKIAGLLE